MLSKYDEDFDSIKADGFRLGAAPTASPKGKARADDEDEPMRLGGEREKVKLSMDYTSEYLLRNASRGSADVAASESFNSDYLQEGEAGFKKPKVCLPVFAVMRNTL